MKILIAEDDQDIALFYKVVLEARNHHVVSPDNGEDCLTIYRQEFGNCDSRIRATASDNKRQQQQQAVDAVILEYKMQLQWLYHKNLNLYLFLMCRYLH